MSSRGTEFLHLTVTAHEAGADPAAWSRFLGDYAGALRADITIVQNHHFDEHRSELLATFGMTQRFTDSYNAHYSSLNVWRERGRGLYVQGQAILDPALYPRTLLKRSEFYNDYLRPNRGTQCLAGVITRCDGVALMLTALRDDGRVPWEEADRRTVEGLLPHLACAQEIQRRIQVLEAGEFALNALAVGLVILAADGRIVFANGAADDVFRANDGLSLLDRRITVSDGPAGGALKKAIRYAISPGESIECPRRVLVPRPSMRRPYHVTATPLKRTPRPFLGMSPPVAVVLIADPERHRPAATEMLRRTYGLTPREAAIAIALAEGSTVRQVADELGMTYETGRTHVRRVLSKTGTCRQAELVILLQRLSQPT
jgi:DNA-binding CsgD family transcriptional regulator